MALFVYTDDIPDANNDPSVDQPDMKINTNSIDELIAVDHVSFNLANGGYHTVIHQTKQLANPLPSANINQIFSKLYTPDTTGGVADTQLFNLTGLGGVSQLTGSLQTSDGWVWCAGLLVQWGIVTFPSSPVNTITFKDRVSGAIPFPNGCFMVVATPTFTTPNPTIQSSIYIKASTLYASDPANSKNFVKYLGIIDTNCKGFTWIAVGF